MKTESKIKFSGLEIIGADAERYLHGRVTQNIKIMPLNSCTQSLLLTPNGRVIADLFIQRRDVKQFYIFSANQEFSQELLAFKVADDFVVRELGPYYLTLNCSNIGENFCFELGFFKFELSSTEQTLTDFNNYRIKNFIPWFPFEINEKILAPELPLVNYVSFNKGCYAGQEVVETATARGRINRELVKLRCLNGISFETEIFSDNKKIGMITTSGEQGQNSIGLAFVKKGISNLKTTDGKSWVPY